jgi:hypothetical protein
MRKALQAILIPAGISTLTLTAPIFSYEDCMNHVEILGEFVYLRRARIHSHSIVEDKTKRQCCTTNTSTNVTTCCPNFEVIDTKDLVRRFWFEPGFRVGLTWHIDRKDSLEARYTWVADWDAQKTAKGNRNTLFFPFDDASYTNNFFHAYKARAKYNSRLRDAELNYWRHLSPRYVNYFSVSGISGFRYSEIKESFKVKFFKDENGVTQESDYRIHTKNHLYGFQIGGNLQWNPLRELSWEATVKGGLMANDATQKTFLGDFNNTVVLRNFHSHRWNPTWLAEALISVAYNPLCYLNIHAGYQFLYYSGIALAPEQISKRTRHHPGQRVYVNGDPMYHGLFAGIVLSF